jgi:hypothetical protein
MSSPRVPLLACQIRFRQELQSLRAVATLSTTKKSKPT